MCWEKYMKQVGCARKIHCRKVLKEDSVEEEEMLEETRVEERCLRRTRVEEERVEKKKCRRKIECAGEVLKEERVDGGEILEEEKVDGEEVPEEDRGWRRGDGVRESGRSTCRDERCCLKKIARMKEKCWRKRVWLEERCCIWRDGGEMVEEERLGEGEVVK